MGRRKVEREGDRLRKLGKDVVSKGVRQGKDNRKKNILKGSRESGLVSGGGGGGSEERDWIVRELGGCEGGRG